MMRNKSLFYGTRCIFCNTKHMTLRTFKIYMVTKTISKRPICVVDNFINGVVIKHWYNYTLHSSTYIVISCIVRMPFASGMKIIFLMLYCYNLVLIKLDGTHFLVCLNLWYHYIKIDKSYNNTPLVSCQCTTHT